MGFFTDLAAGAINSHIQNKYKQDLLKSLVFVVGYNATITRDIKKVIVNILRLVDESVSLFSCEEQIDAVFTGLKQTDSKAFFDSILSTRIDREKIIYMYICNLILIKTLHEDNILSPQQLYNLSLEKKHFLFSKQEMAQCYNSLAVILNLDVDDLAEELEVLTGDEAMEKLEKLHPNLIESDINRISKSEQKIDHSKTLPKEEKLENSGEQKKSELPGTTTIKTDEKAGLGIKVISAVIPLLGLIWYITWKKKYPHKAKSCGKAALIGLIVSVFFSFVLGL